MATAKERAAIADEEDAAGAESPVPALLAELDALSAALPGYTQLPPVQLRDATAHIERIKAMIVDAEGGPEEDEEEGEEEESNA